MLYGVYIHMILSLLNTYLLQIVYVCRDPRDVCVSYFFHQRKLEGYTGTMADFVLTFLDERGKNPHFPRHCCAFPSTVVNF